MRLLKLLFHAIAMDEYSVLLHESNREIGLASNFSLLSFEQKKTHYVNTIMRFLGDR